MRVVDVYGGGYFNQLQRADVCAFYMPPCGGTGGTTSAG